MKKEILQILQMQEDGKLTREQAAELLAILADGAREKNACAGTPRPSSGRRAGMGESPTPGAVAGNAVQSFVDTVTEMGTRVGQAASVWGGEIFSAVHRDEGGNTITLSRLEPPTGEQFTFRGNTINVSKVTRFFLTRSELTNNSINASKLSRASVTDGRLSQCEISGSSLDDLHIAGASIRSSCFSGTKCTTLRLEAESAIDSTTLQGSALRDVSFTHAATLSSCTINSTKLSGIKWEKCVWQRVSLDHSALAETAFRGSDWNQVTLRECKIDGSTWENCTWTNCQLIGCKLHGTVIRGVKLEGKILRGLDLSGKTLDGDEAFAQATGL